MDLNDNVVQLDHFIDEKSEAWGREMAFNIKQLEDGRAEARL